MVPTHTAGRICDSCAPGIVSPGHTVLHACATCPWARVRWRREGCGGSSSGKYRKGGGGRVRSVNARVCAHRAAGLPFCSRFDCRTQDGRSTACTTCGAVNQISASSKEVLVFEPARQSAHHLRIPTGRRTRWCSAPTANSGWCALIGCRRNWPWVYREESRRSKEAS